MAATTNRAISAGPPGQNRCSTGDDGSGQVQPVYDIINCGPRHRFGANGKLVHNSNWQNFTRGSEIRTAIMAPNGYLLAPIDLSQIECRVLCYLAGQDDYIEKFRQGEDPYIGMASKAYGYPVTKAMPAERGTGKQLVLSCGFQAGAQTIVNTAKLGIYGPPVYIDLATGLRWRDAYRAEFYKVVEYWKEAGRNIARLAGGAPLNWGPAQIRDGKIFGPGGTMLHFPGLEYHKPTMEEVEQQGIEAHWRYRNRYGWAKLYAGKLVENVVQWLARIIMSQALIRITRLGYKVANTTHDELLILIPKDGQEQQHLECCMAEMKLTPNWLPGLPLDAEGALSERYAK